MNNKDIDPTKTEGIIITYTGKWFNVFNPDLKAINIRDIAHALSLQCRWSGHTKFHYSIASHSLWVSKNLVTKQDKLAGLCHDFSEAYLVDIPRPIKMYFSQYKEIEDNLMKCISQVFGFEYPMNKKVKEMDNQALRWEWNKFILEDDKWNKNLKYKYFICPKLIEKKIINEFYKLTK